MVRIPVTPACPRCVNTLCPQRVFQRSVPALLQALLGKGPTSQPVGAVDGSAADSLILPTPLSVWFPRPLSVCPADSWRALPHAQWHSQPPQGSWTPTH